MEKYFNLMECEETTPLKEIEKKYKKLMRKTHPDRGNDDKLCKEINEAYQYILDYKINNLIDISNTLIPVNFKDIGFNNIPTPRQYIRKKIELENKKELNKEEIIKQLSNNKVLLLEYLESEDYDNFDNFDNFGDNDIENTFRKNLLASKFFYEYKEKKESKKGILENLFNYFF